MARRDRRDTLRRRRPFRTPHPRFLIVCEDTKTEPGYFKAMRHLEKSLIELELVSPGKKPKPLVEHAVAMKKEAAARAKREKDENLNYDHVWCVFDVDEHPYLPEAKQQARDNGIEVAVSNPCFELWLLLHFCDQRAHIERGPLQEKCRKCRKEMRGYEKQLPTSLLHTLYADALQRAMALDEWQERRGCAEANPSTGVYRLMEQIRTLGKPVN
ncbi:MAG: RloB family protein [Bryobacteraceae bacterium]